MKQKSLFGKNFYWGVSTAAHQVEGKTINQWTVWELAHAKHLAATAEERLNWIPEWPKFAKQATDPNNYISGRGVDHYGNYKLDFALAKKLHFGAFRFGIEWSRIEPQPGIWDKAEIEHYKKYIKELKKQGLEPFLNIWHWTVPTWFEEQGGFKKAANLKYWRRFIRRVAQEFTPQVKYVITLNEPNVYMSFSYLTAYWPPQERSLISASRVIWNLVRAHRQAYRILKRHNPKIQIGIASQLANIQAKRPRNLWDEFSVKAMRYLWNWWFINRIRRQQDFVGFNYYFSDYYSGLLRRENPKTPLNDLGWYMEPEGLYPLLLRVWAHYKTPIFVTENGVADVDDKYRRWWLEETIIAMERALSEGVDLRGYFHWSLVDNFEWAFGWWPKFGLVSVDRHRGMKRTVRPSALWFSKQIHSRSK